MAARALLSSLGDVDIRLLRVFVTVCECNGIAASELELNIGKSTISKHISDLEDRLGLTLCNRGPAGFGLTPEGRRVLELTLELLAQIDRFRSRVDDIHENLTGTLRIGIFDQSSTNPHAAVDAAISLFDELAPEVAFQMTLDTPGALEAGVVEGTLDLAIVPDHKRASALLYAPLYPEVMTLYCGRGHPLFGQDTEAAQPPLDLSTFKYAGYSFNSPNMRAGVGLGVKRAAQVKEEEALALLIQSGRYVGYLADHVASTLNEDGSDRVWPVLPSQTSYEVTMSAITRRRPEPDRKTQRFKQCLIDVHRRQTSR